MLILALKPLLYLNSLPTLQLHDKLIMLIFRLRLIPRHTFVFTVNYTPCKCNLRLPLAVMSEQNTYKYREIAIFQNPLLYYCLVVL